MASPSPVPAQAAASTRPARRSLLAVLTLAYVLCFIDRQIIGVLAMPIQREFSLTDTQLGMLGGLAFAILYTGLGIPVAWLADRRDRSTIVALSVAVWSGFTALCGLAGGFWQLFACRVGVGIGEAGGVAPAQAMIADAFPPERRARALALYSCAIPVGSALGITLGGWIASGVGWRQAFIWVGLAGFVLAPVVRLLAPDPGRSARLRLPQDAGEGFLGKPSFWLLSLGASMSSIVGYGLIFWLPSFFARSYGLALLDLSLFYGAIVLVGGLTGVAGGGWLADRLGRADRAAYGWVPAAAFAMLVPCYAAAMLIGRPWAAFPLFVVAQALGLVWLGPTLAAVQGIAPPAHRARAAASFLFVTNLIGLGLGTLLIGRLSRLLAVQFGTESLRWAILCFLAFYALAALLFALAAPRLRRDWHAEAISPPHPPAAGAREG